MRKQIIVIAGGSTTGKSTLANKLIKDDKFKMYQPLTTREAREGEIYFDYRQVSVAHFEREIESGSFLFYDFLFDNYYGILKDLEHFIESNSNCLFIIPAWRMVDLINCIGRDVVAFQILSNDTTVARKRIKTRGENNKIKVTDRIEDLKRQNEVWIEQAIRIENPESIEEIYEIVIENLKRFQNETK